MAKFKVGDLIRIKNEQDRQYQYNFYYEVLAIEEDSYILRSAQHGGIIDKEYLKKLSHLDEFLENKTPMQFFDESYRTLTDAEKVLFIKS